jgi:hypothetical protein
MRLNKHGWGLRQMLLLSGILIIFLIIAIYYIFVLYNSFSEDVTIEEYYDMEEKLEDQARIYLNDYYDGTLTSDNLTITRSILREYNLDVSLIDDNGDACSGYVIASKSKGITNIDGYIKCNNYETKGYQER